VIADAGLSMGSWRGERLLSTTTGTMTPAVDGLSNQIASSGDPSSDYLKEVSDILSDYEERKKRKQSLIGTVVSTSNTKTISVQVTRQKFFPKYNKVLNARKKIMAHDEDEIGDLGDTVRIVPCRPMSKMKRHKIIDIVKKKVV
jgi:small subunit ribosomal protein S17